MSASPEIAIRKKLSTCNPRFFTSFVPTEPLSQMLPCIETFFIVSHPGILTSANQIDDTVKAKKIPASMSSMYFFIKIKFNCRIMQFF